MNPYRVLVADDDPDYLRLMSGHLRKRGYEVETAENGVQALERMGKAPAFDVLVTDLMMPGMDGYELLRSARALDPRIEVVVISGVGSLESAISSMRENGAYDYLTKPLEKVTDLSLAVERAASHRQLVVERERLQAQIEEERHRLHNLVANASDAILSSRRAGHHHRRQSAGHTAAGEQVRWSGSGRSCACRLRWRFCWSTGARATLRNRW